MSAMKRGYSAVVFAVLCCLCFFLPVNLGGAPALQTTPLMFGARGDGTTDDTDALRRFHTFLGANKTAGYYPGGATYRITGTVTNTTSLIDQGAVILADGDFTSFQIGSGTALTGLRIEVPKITKSTRTWGGTDTGIKVNLVSESTIEPHGITGFSAGLSVTGGQGTMFNLGLLYNNFTNIVANGAVGHSFSGGTLSHDTALGAAVPNATHVALLFSTNCVFNGLTMQGISVERPLYVTGQENYFFGCNWPSATPQLLFTGSGAQGTLVFPGVNGSSLIFNQADGATNNRYFDATLSTSIGSTNNYFVLRLSTINDMLNSSIGTATNGVAVVAGYNAPLDGGGGLFSWNPTNQLSADYWRRFPSALLTTGRWERLYSGNAMLAYAGAAGDGSSDDTAAFNLIRDSVDPNASITIELEPGKTYAGNFVVTRDGVTLKGGGGNRSPTGLSRLVAFDPASPAITVGASAAATYTRGFTLESLKLDVASPGYDAGNTNTWGRTGLLITGGAQDVRVHDVTINEFRDDGIKLAAGTTLGVTNIEVTASVVVMNNSSQRGVHLLDDQTTSVDGVSFFGGEWKGGTGGTVLTANAVTFDAVGVKTSTGGAVPVSLLNSGAMRGSAAVEGTFLEAFKLTGDGVADDRAKFQAAADNAKNSRSKRLILAPSTYYVSTGVDLSGLTIVGNGATLLGDGTNYVVNVLGTIGAYSTLDADANLGAITITDAGLAASLIKGDLVKIRSNADFSPDEPNRHQGEICVVESVSAPTITLMNPLFDTYTVANGAEIAEITPTTFNSDGDWTITNPNYAAGTAPTPQGMRVQYAFRPVIKAKFVNNQYSALFVDDCWAPDVDSQSYSTFTAAVATGYGVAIGNATMFAEVRGVYEGGRASADTGGNSNHGVPWECRFIGVKASSHPSATQAAFSSHASVGSVHYIDCIATGNGASQYGFTAHARRNTFINCRVIGAPFGVYFSSYTNKIESIYINGLEMVAPVATGTAVNINAPTKELSVHNLRGSWGAFGVEINAAGSVDKWEFSNFYSTNGTAIRTLNGATTPSVLTLTDSATGFLTQNDTYANVFLGDADVTTVRLVNVEATNVRYFVQEASSTALAALEMVGCRSYTPLRHHVLTDATVTYMNVVGGEFTNPGTATQYLIQSTASPVVTTFTAMGVKTTGANMSRIIGGNVTTFNDYGNSLHVAYANGTVTGYSIGLPSTGIIPFGLDIRTSSADNTSYVRALTSGKAFLRINGYSASAVSGAADIGGGNQSFQNLNTTDGNGTGIENRDGDTGTINSKILFENVSHANNEGAVRLMTRQASDGSPVDRMRIGKSGNISFGNITGNVIADVDGGFAVRPISVSLTADNQVITVTNRSYVRLGSDSAVATDRTFVLTQGSQDGQTLTIFWTSTNLGELADDSAQSGAGNHRLSVTWLPTQNDTITLIYTGTDWVETGRSVN